MFSFFQAGAAFSAASACSFQGHPQTPRGTSSHTRAHDAGKGWPGHGHHPRVIFHTLHRDQPTETSPPRPWEAPSSAVLPFPEQSSSQGTRRDHLLVCQETLHQAHLPAPRGPRYALQFHLGGVCVLQGPPCMVLPPQVLSKRNKAWARSTPACLTSAAVFPQRAGLQVAGQAEAKEPSLVGTSRCCVLPQARQLGPTGAGAGLCQGRGHTGTLSACPCPGDIERHRHQEEVAERRGRD